MLGGKIVALGLALTAQTVAVKPVGPRVRVRLDHHLSRIEVSGLNLRIAGFQAVGFARAKIIYRGAGLWRIAWVGQNPVDFRSWRLELHADFLRLGLVDAPSELALVPQKRTFEVIAAMSLDRYLEGVLPAEMPASWPLEALKAQAVAARSFVLRSIHEHQNQNFDVEDSVLDQVYRFRSRPNPKVRAAVQATQGEVLYDPEGHILKAYYSADCGCQSEDPRYVWGKIPGFTSVKDPSCRFDPPVKWDARFQRQEVHAKLAEVLRLHKPIQIESLSVASRTPSGRVARVIAWVRSAAGSRAYTIGAQKFRHAFGFGSVRSADFRMQWSDGHLKITGKGLGHGVGLCQRGAHVLAEHGRTYREILLHYYPEAYLHGSYSIDVGSIGLSGFKQGS